MAPKVCENPHLFGCFWQAAKTAEYLLNEIVAKYWLFLIPCNKQRSCYSGLFVKSAYCRKEVDHVGFPNFFQNFTFPTLLTFYHFLHICKNTPTSLGINNK
jgi:hypothetical protein